MQDAVVLEEPKARVEVLDPVQLPAFTEGAERASRTFSWERLAAVVPQR